MRVTLEKPELIALIAKTLGYALQDSDIEVVADPFEVRISNVNIAGLAALKGEGKPVQESEEPAVEDEEEEEEETEATTPAKIITMNEILEQNENMGGAPAPAQHVVEEDLPELTRPLGQYETEEPPEVTDGELKAAGRTP